MKFTIGLDFGTLSCRAVLVDVESGAQYAEAVFEYPHGVMDGEYRGKRLIGDCALQDAHDYFDALDALIPAVIKGRAPADVIGIGIDFTSATILPIKTDGTPLSFLPEFADEPQAAVKLWKHHGAAPDAERLAALLAEYDPERLTSYGGKLSPEWTFPKIMETLRLAPEVYLAADRFIEAGDLICMRLTGKESRSLCFAGFKALYDGRGYPPNEFWRKVDPRLDGIIGTKLTTEVSPPGECVGTLTAEMAERFGLAAGIPVAAAYIDAHSALPACKVTEGGTMLMIIGTSTGHLILSDDGQRIPGICGVVKDGNIPGKYAYEAGQSAVGDIFDWFVKNCVPERYTIEARERKLGIHALLREKARLEAPGESGLLALDWWNGNRSPLQDPSLSGLIVGLKLSTKPEQIYRALLEATAFGTRQIIDGFESGGIRIRELIAAGGIAAKDDFMMQIYADVTGRPIRLAASAQAPALGSAIAAMAAAGVYPDLAAAAQKIGGVKEGLIEPDPKAHAAYERMYALRRELADHFGLASDLMKRLRGLETRNAR